MSTFIVVAMFEVSLIMSLIIMPLQDNMTIDSEEWSRVGWSGFQLLNNLQRMDFLFYCEFKWVVSNDQKKYALYMNMNVWTKTHSWSSHCDIFMLNVENKISFYVAFVKLTKALNELNREWPWKILAINGLPKSFSFKVSFVNFQGVKKARSNAMENVRTKCKNVKKQGCVLATALCNILQYVVMKGKVLPEWVSLHQIQDAWQQLQPAPTLGQYKDHWEVIMDLLFTDKFPLIPHPVQSSDYTS